MARPRRLRALAPERLEFAQLLLDARLEAGLSQATVAARISVHATLVSKFETGDRLPSPAHLRSLARVYGVSHVDLMWRAGYLELPGFGAQRSVEDLLSNPAMALDVLGGELSEHEKVVLGAALLGLRLSEGATRSH
jgi:transcriptional regulator with XRE-family HTH domain